MKNKAVELVTRMRKNMKAVKYSDLDKILLRKRSLVETVFDELKNLCQIAYTRHRSVQNFATNLTGGIVAYWFFPVKPCIVLRDSRDTLATNCSAFLCRTQIDYFLPEAAVVLRQGAGRLIRRETDQGVLVICDSLLVSLSYGKRLFKVLAPMHRPESFTRTCTMGSQQT